MKKSFILALVLLLSLHNSYAQQNIVKTQFIERVLNGLASDEMRGRHAFTADAQRAAEFIANEFKDIGLTPYSNEGYMQSFEMNKVNREEQSITLDGKVLKSEDYLIIGNAEQLNWNQKSVIKIGEIGKSEDFNEKFRAYYNSNGSVIVLVDPSYASYIARFNKIFGKENVTTAITGDEATKVFILADKLPKEYDIAYKNKIEKITMSNVAGIIPGKKDPSEYIVFSGHYDHIGIIKPQGQDSIANGADDDASGITAMISLAKYYKEQNDNARTLIFVAFTGEEVGMFGSKYFSNNINADRVIAMINIEMIGKDSKFGRNSLYITGYDHSNLGKLMQENLKGSDFTFHPDPYTKQNLFYRSDNAVLAKLGVPAHTFSTSQIDKDQYYHTVKDEISTLDIANIKSSIEAIAVGAKGLVDGTQTPSRVEKLKD